MLVEEFYKEYNISIPQTEESAFNQIEMSDAWDYMVKNNGVNWLKLVAMCIGLEYGDKSFKDIKNPFTCEQDEDLAEPTVITVESHPKEYIKFLTALDKQKLIINNNINAVVMLKCGLTGIAFYIIPKEYLYDSIESLKVILSSKILNGNVKFLNYLFTSKYHKAKQISVIDIGIKLIRLKQLIVDYPKDNLLKLRKLVALFNNPISIRDEDPFKPNDANTATAKLIESFNDALNKHIEEIEECDFDNYHYLFDILKAVFNKEETIDDTIDNLIYEKIEHLKALIGYNDDVDRTTWWNMKHVALLSIIESPNVIFDYITYKIDLNAWVRDPKNPIEITGYSR